MCRVVFKTGKECAIKTGMGSEGWDMEQDEGFGFCVWGVAQVEGAAIGMEAADDMGTGWSVHGVALGFDGDIAVVADADAGLSDSQFTGGRDGANLAGAEGVEEVTDERCRPTFEELRFFMAARITEERWISRMATDAGRAMQKHFNAKTPRNKGARVRSCGWPGDGSQGLGNSGDHWIRWLFTAATSRHGALAFSFVCMIAADGVVTEPETY